MVVTRRELDLLGPGMPLAHSMTPDGKLFVVITDDGIEVNRFTLTQPLPPGLTGMALKEDRDDVALDAQVGGLLGGTRGPKYIRMTLTGPLVDQAFDAIRAEPSREVIEARIALLWQILEESTLSEGEMRERRFRRKR